MTRLQKIVLGSILSAVGALLQAQGVNVTPPLPTPIVLPPGNDEILPIQPSSSYFGDAIRIVDCPNTADEPFGTCGNLLFGGLAMFNTHLTGFVHIHFETPANNVAHFEITHPNDMVGTDVFMSAPQMYQFGVGQNRILDDFNVLTQGDLNLLTGEVDNLTYVVFVSNSFYVYLENANPLLQPPAFSFPGGYGSQYAKFTPRTDGSGLLDFSFYGSTFLPLGSTNNGDIVRVPLPMCGPYLNCANIQSQGLSLHPHLSVSTIPNTDPLCGSNCPTIPTQTIAQFTVNTAFSDIGDDFTDLNVAALGSCAATTVKLASECGVGRSQIDGRVQVQFGQQNGNYLPVAVTALPPEGLMVPPPALPLAGLSLGWVGHDEHLLFPNLTYVVGAVATVDDPFDFAVGELDVTTGKFVGGLLWRQFWTQSLLVAILNDNNGAVPLQSFWQRGPADFTVGRNNELLFRFQGQNHLNFTGAFFPSPNYNAPGQVYTAGPGSILSPFNNVQAAMITDAPNQTMSGSSTSTVSTYSQTFAYNYSIPCTGGQNPVFTYTNNTAGGTFTMQNLVSVSCFNSRVSQAASQTYDSIAFTGFGTWSADSNRHVANVVVVNAPNTPYFISIQIDGGTVSNVDLKPVATPTP